MNSKLMYIQNIFVYHKKNSVYHFVICLYFVKISDRPKIKKFNK